MVELRQELEEMVIALFHERRLETAFVNLDMAAKNLGKFINEDKCPNSELVANVTVLRSEIIDIQHKLLKVR